MAVVEQRLGAGLGEAIVLLVERTLEAVRVGAEVERAGEEIGVVEQGGRVAGGHELHGGEIGLDAGLLEAGLGEILRGADEDAGASLNCGAQGGKVAAGFRCQGRGSPAGRLRDTVTVVPSSWTFLFQVSMRVNHSGGGGLVVPRRKTAISR